MFNGRQIAMIGKSGSSAISKAVFINSINQDYITDAQLNADGAGFQHLVDQTQEPCFPMIPVRDPVERFRSACAQEDRTAAQEISRLERGRQSYHTKPTSSYLCSPSKLYKFPEHIKEIARDLGLDEIHKINIGETHNHTPKPVLTKEEKKKVEELYAEDLALFNLIENAGQIYYPE
jgi:hypothetical protein